MADIFSIMDSSGKIIQSSPSPVTIGGLVRNTTYSGMTAVRNYGTDKLELGDVGTTPSAPSVSVKANDGSAQITVTKHSGDGDTQINKATVQYKTADGSSWTSVDTDTSLQASVSGLTNGVNYTAKATINNEFGESDASSETLFTPVKPVVPVTGLTADAALSVKVGGTVKLNVAIAPDNSTDKAFTVTSKDPTVATVTSDGTATGVKAGTVEIDTVSHADPTKTAKTMLTVTEQ